MISTFDSLDHFLDDVSRLKRAYDLLERVYLEIGPYGQKPISDDLRFTINDFFGFDDGE